MSILDPIRHHYAQPASDTILFAASQLLGERDTQEDYFVNFNDECFVIADGVGGMPHGEVAAKLAAETAAWAYKHVRMRPTYWKERKLLLKRIFRTSNIAVWQKQREDEFTDGMATTLLVLIVTHQRMYIGNVGDSSAYRYRDTLVEKLTTDDEDADGKLTSVVGTHRYGLMPSMEIDDFFPNDTIALVTDGVGDYVDHITLQSILAHVGTTTDSLTNAVVELLRAAQANGSRDNMSACIVKKIRTHNR